MSPSPDQPSKPRPRRWRLQYGIRSLLLLTVVCAVLAAYVANFRREHDAEQPAIAALEEIGGKFETAPRGPAWLQWIAGDTYAKRVISVDLHANVTAYPDGNGGAALTLWSPKEWVKDEWLPRLKGLEHLESLNLQQQPITAAGVEHFSQFKQLKTLDLSLTKVDSAALAHLARVRSLRSLDLSDTPIDAAGLAHLADLPELQSLDLSNTPTDDAGLAHVARFSALRSLTLESTKMTNAGLAHLRGLTNLVELRMENTAIGDAGLAHLAGLSGLEKLSLEQTRISDNGLKHLASLTHLVQLQIGEWSNYIDPDAAPGEKPSDAAMPRLTENGLHHLRGLSQLAELSLTGVLVSDVGIGELEQLPKLTELNFRSSRLTKSAIRRLQTWEHLCVLYVSKNSFQRYDKKELDALEKALPGLQLNPRRVSDPEPP